MKKAILSLNKTLTENEILMFKNGEIVSVEIHELLPDLYEAKENIKILKEEIVELKQTIANLAKIVKEK